MPSLPISQSVLIHAPIPSYLEKRQYTYIPQAICAKRYDGTSIFSPAGSWIPQIRLSNSPDNRSGIPGVRMNELLELPPDVLRARIPGFDDTRILEVLSTHVFIKVCWPGYERMDFTACVYLSEQGAGGVSCHGEFAIEVARCYATFLKEVSNHFPEGDKPQWHIHRNDSTFTLEKLVLVAINHRFDRVFQADVALVHDSDCAPSGRECAASLVSLPPEFRPAPSLVIDVGPSSVARRDIEQASTAELSDSEASSSSRGGGVTVQNAPPETVFSPRKLRRFASSGHERGGSIACPASTKGKGKAKFNWQPSSAGIGTGNTDQTGGVREDPQRRPETISWAWVSELADGGRTRGAW